MAMNQVVFGVGWDFKSWRVITSFCMSAGVLCALLLTVVNQVTVGIYIFFKAKKNSHWPDWCVSSPKEKIFLLPFLFSIALHLMLFYGRQTKNSSVLFQKTLLFVCHCDRPSVWFPVTVIRSSVYLCFAAARDAQALVHHELLAKIWNWHCRGMFGYISFGDPTTVCAHFWFTAAPPPAATAPRGSSVTGWPVLKSDGVILAWEVTLRTCSGSAAVIYPPGVFPLWLYQTAPTPMCSSSLLWKRPVRQI